MTKWKNKAKLSALIVASAMGLSSGQAFAVDATDTFTATATTQQGLSVDCGGANVSFGTISIPSGYTGGDTVSVAASTAATATTAGNLVVTGGASLTCTVSGSGGAATAALSDGSATFSTDTLQGVVLTDGVSLDTMSADIQLSKTSTIADGDIYIGGTLTVPSGNAYGTYTSSTITLTVSE